MLGPAALPIAALPALSRMNTAATVALVWPVIGGFSCRGTCGTLHATCHARRVSLPTPTPDPYPQISPASGSSWASMLASTPVCPLIGVDQTIICNSTLRDHPASVSGKDTINTWDESLPRRPGEPPHIWYVQPTNFQPSTNDPRRRQSRELKMAATQLPAPWRAEPSSA